MEFVIIQAKLLLLSAMIESALAAILFCLAGAEEGPLKEEGSLLATIFLFLFPVTANPTFFLAVVAFLVLNSSVNHCFDVWFTLAGLFRDEITWRN